MALYGAVPFMMAKRFEEYVWLEVDSDSTYMLNMFSF